MSACAFFGALRIGEITGSVGHEQANLNLIHIAQLSEMLDRQNYVVAVKLVLNHFKHRDTSAPPVSILLYRDKPVCPVTVLRDYLTLRGQLSGPLFCWPDKQPIARSFFTSCLHQALTFCGLDPNRYKSHSF